MPLMLTDAERAMLNALAAPIDANRRPEFMGAVEKELEAASPAAIGPGTVHRTAHHLTKFLDGAAGPAPRACRASKSSQRLEQPGQNARLDSH
jgi:hypothetical protein